MPLYNYASSSQSSQATAGSAATPSSRQSSTNNFAPPRDTTKDNYERNMAAYVKHYRRSAYGSLTASMAISGGGGGGGRTKASALPSPTAPVFTPATGSNKAARAEAMRKFHAECELRRLRRLENELKEAMRRFELVEKDRMEALEKVRKARAAVPSSLSAGSIGSWTDDDEFIPYIKK